MSRAGQRAAWLGVACCVAAVAGFGAALESFSHAQHPLGLLGARGMPRATAFNLAGFVLPGLVLAAAAVLLRGRLADRAGRVAGVGSWLLAMSAVAFAAQGWLPLDPADVQGPASRAHATAWTLWWIAFVPGALLLAARLVPAPGWRGRGLLLIACALVVLLAALPTGWLPGPLGQRLALGGWLLAYLATAGSRGQPGQHDATGERSDGR